MQWYLYTDGASRGNPGPAGAGAYLVNEAGEEFPLCQYLGEKTNNQAEYAGLLLGLKKLRELGAKTVVIRADSELMIRQLTGRYKVKNPDLKILFDEAQVLLKTFKLFEAHHIPREENKKADALANQAIDES